MADKAKIVISADSGSHPGRAFILDTFLRNYGRSKYADGTNADVLTGLMDTLLIYWNVLYAMDENRKMIIGWIVYKDSHTVGWTFVRKMFRGHGIGTALLDAAGIDTGAQINSAFSPLKFSSFDFRFKPYLPLNEASEARKWIGK